MMCDTVFGVQVSPDEASIVRLRDLIDSCDRLVLPSVARDIRRKSDAIFAACRRVNAWNALHCR